MALVIARQTATVALDGASHRVRRGRTVADADHPVVKAAPHLWRELKVDYPAPRASAPAKPAAKATKSTRKAR